MKTSKLLRHEISVPEPAEVCIFAFALCLSLGIIIVTSATTSVTHLGYSHNRFYFLFLDKGTRQIMGLLVQ